jgi:hypothetical protein
VTIHYRPARRENVPLLLGFAGGTGSGKTYSALRVARGLAGNAPFHFIDTENGRALAYADEFDFLHGEIAAPFRPEKYAEAIAAADAAGAKVIVVDSMSHEWAGDGGILDWHEELEGGDPRKKMTAWIEPKMAHRRFVTRLLQVKAHVILCFRAEPKVDMKRVDGRIEIVPKETLTGLDGWIPISEKNLPFELTASFLLMADRPGVPKPIKLQAQHHAMVSLDAPLDEQTGARLAAWAQGSGSPSPDTTGASDPSSGTGGEPSLDTDASVISQAQRRRLFAIATERGIDKDHLRTLIAAQTGVESTANMSLEDYESLVTLIESRESVSA